MVARWLGVAVGAPSLIVVGLVGGSLLAPSGGPAGSPDSTGPLASALTRPAPVGAVSPTSSVVANVEGRQAVVYRTAGGGRPWRRFSNPTAQHTPLVFLVRGRQGAWLRVMLPSRPNGSEGWVRAAGVELREDAYSIVVGLKDRRLIVRKGNRVLLDAAVGVGRAATPTPRGVYYVTELLRQPNPAGLYGPWAFALSAHSPVLTHFGGGDGQIGIHGTDEPSAIGHTVSHGCIRVLNRVIERLAAILPLGTPVRIVARAREFTGT